MSIRSDAQSSYAIRLPGFQTFIAGQIHELRKQRQWTLEKLCRNYNQAARRRFPDRNYHMTGSALRKLLAARHGLAANRRKNIKTHELDIFADVFQVPIEVLVGADHLVTASQADPAKTAKEKFNLFYQMLSDHLLHASELLGWAEFLPCSLEPQTLMTHHHQSIFSFYEGEHRHIYRDRAVALYDAIGNRQRQRLEVAAHRRPWKFTHLIYENDLLRIFAPSTATDQDYSLCTKQDRLDTIQYLQDILSHKPSWNIEILVLPGDLPRRRRDVRILDTLVVLLDRSAKPNFSFKRYPSGLLEFSTNPDVMQADYNKLITLRNPAITAAAPYDYQWLLNTLKQCRRQVAKWPDDLIS